MVATVAIVGGGYGGITAAQALDDVADVTLIDPKDAFIHNVASLRAAVDPTWADKMFLPYDRLLKNGQVIRDLALSVDSRGATLASGQRVRADFVVLATGTTYPFPAKMTTNHAEASKLRLHRNAAAIRQSGHALILGAGPVGLELAGEILAAWPHKRVTVVDPAPHILSGSFVDGFPAKVRTELRAELVRQIEDMGIELLLGTSIRHELPSAPGRPGAFVATTWSGRVITADIWFRCYGRQPVSGCLAPELAGSRQVDYRVGVTQHLRFEGHRNVFAIGDVAVTGALDTAVVAMEQGGQVAEYISALIKGDTKLKDYEPSQPLLLIPLGPKGGASYSPDAGILDAETTAQFKGDDLFLGKYLEIFGMS